MSIRLFSESLADHMFQHHLHLFDDSGRSDLCMPFDHLRRIFGDFAVLNGCLDKSRLHHTPIVGDGVVKCQRGDRRHLRLISYAHPRQGSVAPVEPLAAFVLLWHTNLSRTGTHNRDVQIRGNAGAIDTAHEFFRIIVVVLVDDSAHADVRAHA